MIRLGHCTIKNYFLENIGYRVVSLSIFSEFVWIFVFSRQKRQPNPNDYFIDVNSIEQAGTKNQVIETNPVSFIILIKMARP